MLLRTLLIFLVCCSAAQAEIRKTADLQLIKQEILKSDKDTLVLFDIDFVLIKPVDDVFVKHADTYKNSFIKKAIKDLESRYAKPDMDLYHSILLAGGKNISVTPDTLSVFNEIKNNGYKMLGITLTGTGQFGTIPAMEKWRLDDLKKFGFNFHNSFPNVAAGTLDKYFEGVKRYSDIYVCSPAVDSGVVFGCQVPKGDLLDAYFKVANIKPKKIIFVDDRLFNVENVAEFCKRENIEFVGYEYTAVAEQAKQINLNERVAKLQFAVLEHAKTWLSDAEAAKILNIIQ